MTVRVDKCWREQLANSVIGSGGVQVLRSYVSERQATRFSSLHFSLPGGRQVKEVCREYGISDAIYYNWKTKYGGMETADIRNLKELADENRRLKQMYADFSLKHEVLKDIVEKML